MNLIKLNRKHYMDKVLTPPDFRPTCAEEAELLGRRRWSLLLSWEPTTDWSCSSWCEVRTSPPMGGKRSGCLRRLSTSVCLSVGAVTIPYRETQRDRESVNAIFSVCSLRYSTHQQEILFLLIWLLLLLAQSPLHNNPIPCDAITIISLTFTQVSFSTKQFAFSFNGSWAEQQLMKKSHSDYSERQGHSGSLKRLHPEFIDLSSYLINLSALTLMKKKTKHKI